MLLMTCSSVGARAQGQNKYQSSDNPAYEPGSRGNGAGTVNLSPLAHVGDGEKSVSELKSAALSVRTRHGDC